LTKIALALLTSASFVLVCFALLALNTAAWAEPKGGFQVQSQSQQGGFVGPGVDMSTVKQAQNMRDDSYVILQGKIIRSLHKDKYEFQDSTGTITVDIDYRKWNGLSVTPDDLIEIQGEIDKDWNSVEVDVDRISLAK
jgi:uncharacterized protein (TIGR00156 family)